MSTNLEERLVESMRDYAASISTAGVTGLARRVRARHRRRQLAIRGTLAAGAAASTAGVLVITLALAQPAPVLLGARAAAYVTAQAERALAGRALGDVVYVRTTLGGPGVHDSPYAPGIKVTSADNWSYGRVNRTEAYAARGRAIANVAVQTEPKALRTTMVLYRSAIWWHLTQPVVNVQVKVPGQSACTVYGVIGGPSLGAPNPPASWPETIRHELACGQMIETGRQLIDGQPVIRLEQQVPPIITLRTVYWVSLSTYLPVRIRMSSTSGQYWWEQEDFSWLRPTPANLARVRVQIPAGFRRVRAPAAGYFLGFFP
jgi:hypothetical protein